MQGCSAKMPCLRNQAGWGWSVGHMKARGHSISRTLICLSGNYCSLWLVLRRGLSQKRADVGTAPRSQGRAIFKCSSITHQCGLRGFQLWFFFLLLCVLKTYLNNCGLGLGCWYGPAFQHTGYALRSHRALPGKSQMSVGLGVLAPVFASPLGKLCHGSEGWIWPISVNERSPIPIACFPL